MNEIDDDDISDVGDRERGAEARLDGRLVPVRHDDDVDAGHAKPARCPRLRCRHR